MTHATRQKRIGDFSHVPRSPIRFRRVAWVIRAGAHTARTRQPPASFVNLLRILEICHLAREVTSQYLLVDARIVTEVEAVQAAEHAEDGLRDVACNDRISELAMLNGRYAHGCLHNKRTFEVHVIQVK